MSDSPALSRPEPVEGAHGTVEAPQGVTEPQDASGGLRLGWYEHHSGFRSRVVWFTHSEVALSHRARIWPREEFERDWRPW